MLLTLDGVISEVRTKKTRFSRDGVWHSDQLSVYSQSSDVDKKAQLSYNRIMTVYQDSHLGLYFPRLLGDLSNKVDIFYAGHTQ